MGKSNKERGTSGKTETHSIGALLRKLRRDKELTQQKVAEALGLSRDAAYQKYEHGTVVPPPDKLAKLAEIYGVTTDYLLGRETASTVGEPAASYGDNLDAMACKLAYHEIMRAIEGRPRKLAEFRRLLETFRSKT